MPGRYHHALIKVLAQIFPSNYDLFKWSRWLCSWPMSQNASPQLKNFAGRLLAFEAPFGKYSEAKESPAVRFCAKLAEPLGQLIGTGGFRSLLSRAVALSGAEVPWLRGVHVNGDGLLEGLPQLRATLDSRTIIEGETVLVAELLGILITLIGPAMTFQFLHQIWPRTKQLDF